MVTFCHLYNRIEEPGKSYGNSSILDRLEKLAKKRW
jgi:hypothetical protein